ncbi:MAG TPA: SAM-dependent methyltransferase [Elusimicrobiota bacterium]|jgi:SAM-dependent MidA family methyltransferase|nr:SAM-dependent methyltransferase [Elusimicrobiota bacterium]
MPTTFRDYMESALYAPKDGFYARREPRADFYTAPELHPAFAETLAREIAARLKSLGARRPKEPLFVVEVGSGTGALAGQLLRALRDGSAEWRARGRYVLVERVESVLLDSVLALREHDEKVLGYSRMSDVPPLCGVVLSNELLDAMPVHVIEKRDGRVGEVYVEAGPDGAEARVGSFSRRELATAAKAVAESLPEGGRHAVNLGLDAWCRELARVLKAGAAITVDYGARLDAATPNPPRYFRRHQTGADVVDRPGEKDLTASVDFSALMRAGERRGLRTASFSTLGKFLLERGIVERMPAGDTLAAYKERNQIKTLFHPEGMGDSFKVLIQEKN